MAQSTLAERIAKSLPALLVVRVERAEQVVEEGEAEVAAADRRVAAGPVLAVRPVSVRSQVLPGKPGLVTRMESVSRTEPVATVERFWPVALDKAALAARTSPTVAEGLSVATVKMSVVAQAVAQLMAISR